MWGKPTLFHWEKSIEKNTEIYMYIYIYIYIYILTKSIEKSFLIDPLKRIGFSLLTSNK